MPKPGESLVCGPDMCKEAIDYDTNAIGMLKVKILERKYAADMMESWYSSLGIT